MDSRQFRDKVLQHFRFLIDDYGFSLLSSKEYYPEGTSKWIVLLRLNDCWMKVMLDKVQVFIDVGLFSTPKDWFDLGVVTAFLTRETGAGDWEYDKVTSQSDMTVARCV
jgi:hypothetical protein